MSFGNSSFGQPSTNTTGAAPTFAQPASSTGFDLTANEGALLMITPSALKEDISTAYGTANAVEATVVVLDGPNAGEKIEDALLFPKVLQGQLKKYVGTGQIALGRLGKGQAKPGQSQPWMLQDFTPEDAQVAQNYLNQNTNDLPSY